MAKIKTTPLQAKWNGVVVSF